MVPDVRRRAHDDEEVVRAPVRDRLTLVEHDPVDSDPAPVQHIAVDADRIGTQVFERECPHQSASSSRTNHTSGTPQWLRRDLVRKIEGLGLPVTIVPPTQKSLRDAYGDSDDVTRWLVLGECRLRLEPARSPLVTRR